MRNLKKAKAEKTKPTHIAKTRHGKGQGASYERIGAGWFDEDSGALFVRLHGNQIITDPFTLYLIEE